VRVQFFVTIFYYLIWPPIPSYDNFYLGPISFLEKKNYFQHNSRLLKQINIIGYAAVFFRIFFFFFTQRIWNTSTFFLKNIVFSWTGLSDEFLETGNHFLRWYKPDRQNGSICIDTCSIFVACYPYFTILFLFLNPSHFKGCLVHIRYLTWLWVDLIFSMLRLLLLLKHAVRFFFPFWGYEANLHAVSLVNTCYSS
jgi:hypothetical protein